MSTMSWQSCLTIKDFISVKKFHFHKTVSSGCRNFFTVYWKNQTHFPVPVRIHVSVHDCTAADCVRPSNSIAMDNQAGSRDKSRWEWKWSNNIRFRNGTYEYRNSTLTLCFMTSFTSLTSAFEWSTTFFWGGGITAYVSQTKAFIPKKRNRKATPLVPARYDFIIIWWNSQYRILDVTTSHHVRCLPQAWSVVHYLLSCIDIWKMDKSTKLHPIIKPRNMCQHHRFIESWSPSIFFLCPRNEMDR